MPGTGSIREWSEESRCKERVRLAHILLDRGIDVAASQRRGQSFG